MHELNDTLRLPTNVDLAVLEGVIGEARVFSGEETLERYSRDESTRLHALPTCVVLPRSEDEVALTLAWADAGRFPIIPRGAGTGVAGGALALAGGVVVSVEKLDSRLDIDRENMVAIADPGVVTERIQEEAARANLFYPPDPASLDACSIGGNVAVGAGGARAVRYGTTRDYVLGLELALPSGRIAVFGSRNIKDATGYRLAQLVVGSEGTLGIVTGVTLRLIPRPRRVAALLCAFDDIGTAASAVSDMLQAGVLPAVAEFMDDVTIRHSAGYLGRELPGGEGANAFALVELHGESQSSVDEQMSAVGEIAESRNALAVIAAEDEGQRNRLWESRRIIAKALKAVSSEIGKADVVVPRGRVVELVREVKELAGRLGLTIACFGHAGDGNVHVNVLKGELDATSWETKREEALNGVMKLVSELGGLPSGEHGVGALKIPFVEPFVGSDNVELMRAVKAVFDPNGIMNPGKVFEPHGR